MASLYPRSSVLQPGEFSCGIHNASCLGNTQARAPGDKLQSLLHTRQRKPLYDSTSTILACKEMAASTGVQVLRVDFSDPQGGKGAADRLAASCKRHIRAFIDEGNDVCTADELKDALLSHGGLKGVRVVSLDTIIETPDSGQTITGITKLNNFEFSSTESVTCWRAYCVGRGKIINPGSSSSKYGN